MEFQQLRYFISVARHGNFSRAAENCHVSQPSLSQQIKKLEKELGQTLFIRTRRGAVLTAFGESLLPRARSILAEAERITQDGRECMGSVRGKLSLGAIPTIAPYLLPTILTSCLKSFPRLELHVEEDTTDQLIEKLGEGLLDFALVSPPFDGQNEFEVRNLWKDALWVTLHPDHPLAVRQAIPLSVLEPYSMILMKEAHCLSRQSISICESSNFKPRVTIESSQLETVIALIEAGIGYSFIPDLAKRRFQDRSIVFRPLTSISPNRLISLVWTRKPTLTPAHQALLEICGQLSPKYKKFSKNPQE